MQSLIFVTGSIGKFKEVQAYLGDAGIKVRQAKVDLPEIQELDTQKIVEEKAKEAKRRKYRNFIIEDSSLVIHGLGKLPGPFTKWFQKELGNEGTYLMATRVGKGTAIAMTMFAYCDKRGKIEYFKGVTEGSIVSPRGENGFGWDKIFRPQGSHKTFGEMEWGEKAGFSMRVKALEALKKRLLR